MPEHDEMLLTEKQADQQCESVFSMCLHLITAAQDYIQGFVKPVPCSEPHWQIHGEVLPDLLQSLCSCNVVQLLADVVLCSRKHSSIRKTFYSCQSACSLAIDVWAYTLWYTHSTGPSLLLQMLNRPRAKDCTLIRKHF